MPGSRRGGADGCLGPWPETLAVQVSLPLPYPLHSLLLAGALTADTALKRQEPSETSSV